MNTILSSLLLSLVLVAALPGLYLGLLAVVGLLPRRSPPESCLKRKIAVLVPAHNEASGIAGTVRSILRADYPIDRFRIVVIADNCTDPTARVAKRSGARVLVRTNPDARGKGQALDWALRHHADEFRGFDLVAIVDADTCVDPGFLPALNREFARPGVRAVQGFYGVSNPSGSWRTRLSAAALSLAHHLRPLGRNRLGGTAGLKGNGMAFSTSLLLHIGWPAHSVVEDHEMALSLLLQGVRIRYSPHARVFGEMPVSGAQAASQRLRWEGGRAAVHRRFLAKLLAPSGKGSLPARIDAVVDLLTPPLSQYAMGMLLGGLLLLPLGEFYSLPLLLAFSASCFALFLALRQTGADWKTVAALFMSPIFLLWKLTLRLKAGTPSPSTWVRTPRLSELQ